MSQVKLVDARGLSCPEPVIKSKKVIKEGCNTFEVLVDNEVAKNNVKRLLERYGYDASITTFEQEYKLKADKS